MIISPPSVPGLDRYAAFKVLYAAFIQKHDATVVYNQQQSDPSLSTRILVVFSNTPSLRLDFDESKLISEILVDFPDALAVSYNANDI